MRRKPSIKSLEEAVVIDTVIDDDGCHRAKFIFGRLNLDTTVEIGLVHTALQGPLSPHGKRGCDCDDLISETEAICEITRCGNLDDSKRIMQRRDCAADGLEKTGGELIDQHRMDDRVQSRCVLGCGKSPHSKQGLVDAPIGVQDIPTKGIRQIANHIGTGHVKRFCKLIEVDGEPTL